MKTFIILIVFLSALVSAFGQVVPQALPQTTPQVNCPATEDILYFSNWKDASVSKICAVPGFPVVPLFSGAPGVQKTIATFDAMYAFSSGKVYVYRMYPDGGIFLDSSRIFGGGFAHEVDEANSNFTLQFPYEAEAYKVFAYPGGYSYSQPANPLYHDIRGRCMPVVEAGIESCLDPSRWLVWIPGVSPFGYNDWSHPISLFANQQPVNLATDGTDLFVTLGTKYEFPSTPTPGPVTPTSTTFGKLARVHTRSGNLNTEVLVDNVDIQSDLSQDRLAVSQKGVYFISTVHSGDKAYPVLSFYSFKLKTVMPILAGTSEDFFSALSLAPKPQVNAATSPTNTAR